jgi:transposase
MDEKTFTGRRSYERYPETVKAALIKEYLTSACTLSHLRRKYCISSVSMVQHWVKKVEKKRYLSMEKRMQSMAKDREGEPPEVQQLKQRIRQLERELEDAKLISEAYSIMIRKAEEELKIPIRKKFNTK